MSRVRPDLNQPTNQLAPSASGASQSTSQPVIAAIRSQGQPGEGGRWGGEEVMGREEGGRDGGLQTESR